MSIEADQVGMYWRSTISIHTRDTGELHQAFRKLGGQVGPRTGLERRTKDDKEWYCIRRYLLTLDAHGLLKYPSVLRKGERPDFAITDTVRGTYGVEVTEATERDWQRDLTNTEREVERDLSLCP